MGDERDGGEPEPVAQPSALPLPDQPPERRTDHQPEPEGVGRPAVPQPLGHRAQWDRENVEVRHDTDERAPGERRLPEPAPVESLAEGRAEQTLGERIHAFG